MSPVSLIPINSRSLVLTLMQQPLLGNGAHLFISTGSMSGALGYLGRSGALGSRSDSSPPAQLAIHPAHSDRLRSSIQWSAKAEQSSLRDLERSMDRSKNQSMSRQSAIELHPESNHRGEIADLLMVYCGVYCLK